MLYNIKNLQLFALFRQLYKSNQCSYVLIFTRLVLFEFYVMPFPRRPCILRIYINRGALLKRIQILCFTDAVNSFQALRERT